jgi:DNA sulfur modification protein DndD
VLEQGRLEAEIQRDTKQLEIARGKLSQVRARSVHGQVGRRRYQLASEAAQAAQHLLSTFSADMRQQIERATDEIFKQFVWKEKQFDSVHVTDDYRLEVEDRFHTTSLAGLSAGERQVLSLAFIAGMSRVTGEEAPLVIDTPFGRLSELPVTSIVQTLPYIAKQLVLFVTDREIDAESRQLLAPRVGREYTLRFDDESGSTSVETAA